MPDKTHLLLTNDDGIFAPGLRALAAALRRTGAYELSVVAPESEKSGVGHALTLREPLHAWPVDGADFFHGEDLEVPAGFRCFAVAGTPADCVKLALTQLLRDKPPALVLSGINGGLNVGINVFYSGTVAAAREAVFCGVPGAALSVEAPPDGESWGYAAAAELLLPLLAEPALRHLSAGVAVNLNVPHPLAGTRGARPVRGMKITRHGRSGFKEFYTEQEPTAAEAAGASAGSFSSSTPIPTPASVSSVSPSSNAPSAPTAMTATTVPPGTRRFQLDGVMVHRDETDELDAEAVRRGWISVTPLGLSLDDEQGRRHLQNIPLFKK